MQKRSRSRSRSPPRPPVLNDETGEGCSRWGSDERQSPTRENRWSSRNKFSWEFGQYTDRRGDHQREVVVNDFLETTEEKPGHFQRDIPHPEDRRDRSRDQSRGRRDFSFERSRSPHREPQHREPQHPLRGRGGGDNIGRWNSTRGYHHGWDNRDRGNRRGRGRGRGSAERPRGYSDASIFSYMDMLEMKTAGYEKNVMFLIGNLPRLKVSLESLDSLRTESFILIFSQLCSSKTLESNIRVIMSLLAQSKFFTDSVVDYLNQPVGSGTGRVLELVSILVYLLNILPSAIHDTITLIRPRLQLFFNKRKTHEDSTEMKEFKKLQVLHDAIEDKLCRGETLDDDVEDEVTNDFVYQPILPNAEDIGPDSEPPDLKENIVKGKYKSGFHYLDTQFRLLREDLIGPLRSGIRQYREYRKQGKHFYRLDDGYCYTDVRLCFIEPRSRGVGCRVQFDVSHLRRIKWHKRLLRGNLVCMSSDDFATFICATVEERIPDDLARGEIVLLLHSTLFNMLDTRQTWTMIEATSYYEAYRYVLTRLQDLGDLAKTRAELPFHRYFVSCNIVVEPPLYLVDAEVDFGILMDRQSEHKLTLPERDDTEVHSLVKRRRIGCGDENVAKDGVASTLDTSDEEKVTSLGFCFWVGCSGTGKRKLGDPSVTNKYKIKPLELEEWEKLKGIGLDTSQVAALQNAMTHDLSVIQGPPGTGKSFIGVCFVELLLANKAIWKEHLAASGDHIMVMCYTNHALDQFLEGILDLSAGCKSLVRIGGRSKNERLQPYVIWNKRRQFGYRQWGAVNMLRDEIANLNIQLKKHMAAFNFKPSKLAVWKVESAVPQAHALSLLKSGQDMIPAIIVWLAGAVPSTINKTKFQNVLNKVFERDEEHTAHADQRVVISMRVNTEAKPFEEELLLYQEDAERLVFEREIEEDNWLSDYLEQREQWTRQLRDHKRPIVLPPRDIAMQLDRSEPMPADEADLIEDVWELPEQSRFSLYLHWCAMSTEYKDIKGQHIFQQLQEKYKQLDEYDHLTDLEVMKNSEIIGVTTTGAAKYHDLIQKVKPRIVIVEEAAEVLEAHIVTALTENCQHLVLIGDHKQLRPNPTMYNLAKEYNLDISLFERMVRNNLPVSTLEFQHRMRPEISQFLVPHIYKELKDHEVVSNYDHIRGIKGDVIFLNHAVEEASENDTRSHTNYHEAALVVGMCGYLLKQGYDPKQLTVLTMYSGQMLQIRCKLNNAEINGVRVVPVDSFQGEENDIILLSCVRSNKSGKIGFLKASNRICVALSRAKAGFYCFGDFTMYAKQNDVWKAIVDDVTKQGLLRSHIPLFCSRHNKETKLSKEDDFKKVPNGGCSEPCDFRLDCGHVCSLVCHIVNQKHDGYKCEKPCEKECKNKHKTCSNTCCEVCSPCVEVIKVKNDGCGHEYEVKCSLEHAPCSMPCTKQLGCGHVGSFLCHSMELEQQRYMCKMPCKRECKNKHSTCKNRCFEKCTPCDKVVCVNKLGCGHEYNALCSSEDDPCSMSCEKLLECGHRCKQRCGDPCSKALCTETVSVEKDGCGHKYITECFKEDHACIKPCERELPCGHKCTNTCGSTCTDSCKKRIKVEKPCGHVYSGPCCSGKLATKDSTNTCFETIEKKLECGHVLEMECWQDTADENGTRWCQIRIGKKLSCGHKKMMKCCAADENDSLRCQTRTEKKLPCGHKKMMECWVDPVNEICQNPCRAKLTCGHSCKGTCSTRHLLHEECWERCRRNLICSHPCYNRCCEPCGPCTKRSNFRCGHTIHSQPCYSPTVRCVRCRADGGVHITVVPRAAWRSATDHDVMSRVPGDYDATTLAWASVESLVL